MGVYFQPIVTSRSQWAFSHPKMEKIYNRGNILKLKTTQSYVKLLSHSEQCVSIKTQVKSYGKWKK